MPTHELCPLSKCPMRLICVRSSFNYPVYTHYRYISIKTNGIGTRNCAAFYPVLQQNAFTEVTKCIQKTLEF